MEKFICGSCKEEVNKEAATCPHCRSNLLSYEARQQNKQIFGFSLLAIIVCYFLGAVAEGMGLPTVSYIFVALIWIAIIVGFFSMLAVTQTVSTQKKEETP